MADSMDATPMNNPGPKKKAKIIGKVAGAFMDDPSLRHRVSIGELIAQHPAGYKEWMTVEDVTAEMERRYQSLADFLGKPPGSAGEKRKGNENAASTEKGGSYSIPEKQQAKKQRQSDESYATKPQPSPENKTDGKSRYRNLAILFRKSGSKREVKPKGTGNDASTAKGSYSIPEKQQAKKQNRRDESYAAKPHPAPEYKADRKSPPQDVSKKGDEFEKKMKAGNEESPGFQDQDRKPTVKLEDTPYNFVLSDSRSTKIKFEMNEEVHQSSFVKNLRKTVQEVISLTPEDQRGLLGPHVEQYSRLRNVVCCGAAYSLCHGNAKLPLSFRMPEGDDELGNMVSALFQLMQGGYPEEMLRKIITKSQSCIGASARRLRKGMKHNIFVMDALDSIGIPDGPAIGTSVSNEEGYSLLHPIVLDLEDEALPGTPKVPESVPGEASLKPAATVPNPPVVPTQKAIAQPPVDTRPASTTAMSQPNLPTEKQPSPLDRPQPLVTGGESVPVGSPKAKSAQEMGTNVDHQSPVRRISTEQKSVDSRTLKNLTAEPSDEDKHVLPRVADEGSSESSKEEATGTKAFEKSLDAGTLKNVTKEPIECTEDKQVLPRVNNEGSCESSKEDVIGAKALGAQKPPSLQEPDSFSTHRPIEGTPSDDDTATVSPDKSTEKPSVNSAVAGIQNIIHPTLTPQKVATPAEKKAEVTLVRKEQHSTPSQPAAKEAGSSPLREQQEPSGHAAVKETTVVPPRRRNKYTKEESNNEDRFSRKRVAATVVPVLAGIAAAACSALNSS